MPRKSVTERVIELAKRRGFFWPAYEVYGGLSGFFIFGPLGVGLKENIVNIWREMFVEKHDFIEIESPLLAMHKVFEASGHVASFKDIVSECTSCGRKYRADHLLKESGIEASEAEGIEGLRLKFERNRVKCLECGNTTWKFDYFSTMFATTVGPYSGSLGFLRPETAQGMFVEYRRLYEIARAKMPLGVAQVGRSFRNEISPRQWMIRLREFSMMEVELFFDSENPHCPYIDEVSDYKLRILSEEMVERKVKDPIILTVREALSRGLIKQEWMAYFMALSSKFLERIGIDPEKQRFEAKLKGERAHYSAQTYDHEVLLDEYGWIELAGHAYRTDFDLSSHAAYTQQEFVALKELLEPVKIVREEVQVNFENLRGAFKEEAKKIFKLLSTMGSEKILNALKTQGFVEVGGYKLSPDFFSVRTVEERTKVKKFVPHVVEPSFGIERTLYSVLEHSYSERDGKVVLRLKRELAPISVAVYPLVKKDNLTKKALEIYTTLRKERFRAIYDDDGSIGRRYARSDEIGVPVAITIDYQTLEDNTVTLRDRDTTLQIRVSVDDLKESLRRFLLGEKLENLPGRPL